MTQVKLLQRRSRQSQAMNDGHWMSVEGDDGETIAVVCSLDGLGIETLISEAGRRLLRDGPHAFVDAVSGRRYRERARDVLRERRENGTYEIDTQERDGYLELQVRGDFRHSSAVESAWRRAVASLGTSATRRVLVVRGPGRAAGEIDKLDLLRRIFGASRGEQRVALVMPGHTAAGATMLLGSSRAQGLDLAMFAECSEAERWLIA